MISLPNKLLIIGDDHYIYFGGEEMVSFLSQAKWYQLVEQYGVGPIDARDKMGRSILGPKFPLDKLRGQKKVSFAMVRELAYCPPWKN